jgi:hypothetical protein
MIDYIVDNAAGVVLVCEVLFVIAFVITASLVIMKMDRQSRDMDALAKQSEDEHQMVMAHYRRGIAEMESLVDEEQEVVTRTVN